MTQTFTDWELIVCDSYSDDGTWEYLGQYKDDPRVRLHQVPRDGLYAGWNECLKRCRAEYVYFAMADDTCEPETLEALLLPLEKHPALSLSACSYKLIDEYGADVVHTYLDWHRSFIASIRSSGSIVPGAKEFVLQALLGISWQTMSAVLFRKSLVDRIGDFPTGFGNAGDLCWILKALAVSDVCVSDAPLVTWRQHSSQASVYRGNPEMFKNHFLAIREAFQFATQQSRDCDYFQKKNVRRSLLLPSYTAWCKVMGVSRAGFKSTPLRFLVGLHDAAKVDPILALYLISQLFTWDCYLCGADLLNRAKELVASMQREI